MTEFLPRVSIIITLGIIKECQILIVSTYRLLSLNGYDNGATDTQCRSCLPAGEDGIAVHSSAKRQNHLVHSIYDYFRRSDSDDNPANNHILAFPVRHHGGGKIS